MGPLCDGCHAFASHVTSWAGLRRPLQPHVLLFHPLNLAPGLPRVPVAASLGGILAVVWGAMWGAAREKVLVEPLGGVLIVGIAEGLDEVG